jgi:hypothetical protein
MNHLPATAITSNITRLILWRQDDTVGFLELLAGE